MTWVKFSDEKPPDPLVFEFYRPDRAERRRATAEERHFYTRGGLACRPAGMADDTLRRIRERIREGARKTGMTEYEFAMLLRGAAAAGKEDDAVS